MLFKSTPTSYQSLLYKYTPTPKNHTITIAWFGTACELISDGETAILVDPFLTRNAGLIDVITNKRVLKPDPKNYDKWIAPLKEPIKAMLITQSHYDHILDAGEIGKRTGALLFGSPSTAMVGESLGLPQKQIEIITERKSIRIGKFQITFLKSKHSGTGIPSGKVNKAFSLPASVFDLKEGGAFVLYIEHPSGNIVCCNSASYMPGLLKGLSANVMFLSIAHVPNNLENLFKETLDTLGASYLFPVHWDNFFQPLNNYPQNLPIVSNLNKFVKNAQKLRPQIKTHTLQIGQNQVIYPK